MRVLWLVLMLSAGSCIAQSPAVCPWFTTGSAVVTLGGPVQVDLHVENNLQGTCRFKLSSAPEPRSIEITIGKADTHACSAGSARVVALGNEAAQCKTNTGGSALDVIAGRVRDIYFVIAMRNVQDSESASPSPGYPEDRDKPSVLEQVAEQVVGNLY